MAWRCHWRPTSRLEVFCEEAFLWTEDDFLGPLHVETSHGTEIIEAEAPGWLDRLNVPQEFAVHLPRYCEPSKKFLDALVRDENSARGFPDVEVALEAHKVVEVAHSSASDGGKPYLPG